jgi:hypothetical protein
MLHHSIGLALRMSRWAFLKILFRQHLVFFVNPFSGLLYKKGGVFWIIWDPLKICFSSMPIVNIRHLVTIGLPLENF